MKTQCPLEYIKLNYLFYFFFCDSPCRVAPRPMESIQFTFEPTLIPSDHSLLQTSQFFSFDLKTSFTAHSPQADAWMTI